MGWGMSPWGWGQRGEQRGPTLSRPIGMQEAPHTPRSHVGLKRGSGPQQSHAELTAVSHVPWGSFFLHPRSWKLGSGRSEGANPAALRSPRPHTYPTSRCRGVRGGHPRRGASVGRTAPPTSRTAPSPTAPGRTSRAAAAGTDAPSIGSTSARCRGSNLLGLGVGAVRAASPHRAGGTLCSFAPVGPRLGRTSEWFLLTLRGVWGRFRRIGGHLRSIAGGLGVGWALLGHFGVALGYQRGFGAFGAFCFRAHPGVWGHLGCPGRFLDLGVSRGCRGAAQGRLGISESVWGFWKHYRGLGAFWMAQGLLGVSEHMGHFGAVLQFLEHFKGHFWGSGEIRWVWGHFMGFFVGFFLGGGGSACTHLRRC